MSINDRLSARLTELGFSGALPDKMFKYLRAIGYTGSIPDMLFGEGGFKSFTDRLINKEVLVLNGADQYIEHESITPSTITLDVKPTSGGNNGLPTGCPALTNGVRQEVSFAFVGSLTELFKNGANFFHGEAYSASYDSGEIYLLNDGFSVNPIARNSNAKLGSELWTFGVVVPDGTGAPLEILAGSSSSSVPTNSTVLVTISWANLTGRLRMLVSGDATGSTGVQTNDTGSLTYLVNTDANTRLQLQDQSGGAVANSVTITVKEAPGYGEYINLTSASWSSE